MKVCDVLIIGAGPAGAIAGANLAQKGFSVEILEKLDFPRFVIGESLLPLCNAILDKNNLLERIEKQKYTLKAGAIFQKPSGKSVVYDFRKSLNESHNTSFQVKREAFDYELLKGAEAFGAKVSHGMEVIAYNQKENQITAKDKKGKEQKYQAKFVLDASGYGRVLPKLLDLDTPSDFKVRNAIFTRVENDIRPTGDLSGFITVFIHDNNQAWIWVIPFSDGITSVGVVCSDEYFEKYKLSEEDFFTEVIQSNPQAKERFKNAKKIQAVNRIHGFSSNVKSMHGKGFALAGNATEFLDPVFSSGVTLALKSGDLAADLIAQELEGKSVNWQVEYADYMMKGIDVFRAFVLAWYDGRLHKILFSAVKKESYAHAISSILSGYVWNDKNVFVGDTEKKIDLLVQLIEDMKEKDAYA